MANTTVTDTLYMANVTQVNAIESSKKLQSEGASFAKAMGDATLQNEKVSDSTADMGIKAGGRTTVENNARDIKADSKLKKTAGNADAGKPDKMENAAKEALKKADDIKNGIKEKLDVTDEEIEETMQALGLMVQDLFNPEELQKLMMELAGCEDSLELLTNADLYNSMQEILSGMANISETIASDCGVTAEELAQLLADDELFEKIVRDAQTQIGEDTFGPIMENEEFQAEVPGITPDHVGVQSVVKNDRAESYDDQHINVSLTREDDVAAESMGSRTETFKNISQTEKTQSNNNGGMENMPQTVTNVMVNELGDVVETVERFTSAYSDVNEIISQVTESIKLNISQDTTSMEMMLHPATLGTVNMQISSQNGTITAHILVQNEAVRAALESQLSALLETFEEQGRTVEAVEVSVANYNLNKGMQQNTRDEQERENAFNMGRGARRRLKLDEMADSDIDGLDDDEKLAADMMRRQGNSLDYMA